MSGVSVSVSSVSSESVSSSMSIVSSVIDVSSKGEREFLVKF